MDTQLVDKIAHEVKSQGVFDEFRKDSIADVDTKPAYQNLRQRVENTVKKFLSEQKWSLETNKNQLREKLRRHITESGFLDLGVERIVDQVVNPKIGSVFQPRIEEIAYKYLGLPPPPKKFDPPPPPLMHPFPPLPLSAPPLKIETSSLLPTDLEQVSPDSDNATIKSEGKHDETTVEMDTEEKLLEDEDESPPFEPLVKFEVQDIKDDVKIEPQKEKNGHETEVLVNDGVSKFLEINDALIKTEIVANNTDSQEISNFEPESIEIDKEASHLIDTRISQDSQLSSVSSDSRLSGNMKDDSLQSSSQEAVAANISEEAQMPKFNENSCELNLANGNSCENVIGKSELHFDIKKDEIKFEGTERKIDLEAFNSIAVKSEEERYSSMEDMNGDENKNDSFNFVTEKLSTDAKEDVERTQNAQELSFGSSIEDSLSVPPSQTVNITNKEKEEIPTEIYMLKDSTTPLETPTNTSVHTQDNTIILLPIATQKREKEHQIRCSSSSSKHKKHSKDRRSYERGKEKDEGERHRSSKDTKHSYKYHSKSGSKSSNKHSSSSSSSKFHSTHSKSTEKDIEKSSSSSTHYSLKNAKHSNSHSHSSSSSIENQESKKSKRDSDKRHRSSSSSKRSERKDDHTEAKLKIQRRKTTDSNDDDDNDGNKNSQNKSSNSSYGSKSSKSNSSENKSSTYKAKEYQKNQTENKQNEQSYGTLQPNNNVVILNDLLENPQTQFIQLNNTGHSIEMPLKAPTIETESNEIVPAEFNNNVALHSFEKKHETEPDWASCEENKACSPNNKNVSEENQNSNDLLYFEEEIPINDRLKLINATMDLCRNAVNSLRFDSLNAEGVELSNEQDVNCEDTKIPLSTETLKRRSDSKLEEFLTTPRKRFISNESDGCQSKASPTPSDTSSVNSKENEEICKNTNRTKKPLLDNPKAIQKLTQQQRYASEDLYKPRPILGQRSRRRGLDSLL